jgi:hypothetical protein
MARSAMVSVKTLLKVTVVSEVQAAVNPGPLPRDPPQQAAVAVTAATAKFRPNTEIDSAPANRGKLWGRKSLTQGASKQNLSTPVPATAATVSAFSEKVSKYPDRKQDKEVPEDQVAVSHAT